MHTRDAHVAVTGGRIRYRVVGHHEGPPLVIVDAPITGRHPGACCRLIG
jgi:hypothetical protein